MSTSVKLNIDGTYQKGMSRFCSETLLKKRLPFDNVSSESQLLCCVTMLSILFKTERRMSAVTSLPYTLSANGR